MLQMRRRSVRGGLLQLACVLLAFSNPGRADETTLPVTLTTTCPASQIFDASSMACTACAKGFPSTDQLSCTTCDSTAGAAYSFTTGNSITQIWQPAAGTTSCTCGSPSPAYGGGAGVVLSTVFSNGISLQRCIACPAGWQSNSAGQCTPTGSSLTSTTPTQDLQYVTSALRLNINPASAIQASFASTTISPSAPLAVLLGPSAKACLLGQNRAACNAVANLCVLQQYNGDTGACQLYDALVAYFAGTTITSRKTQSATKPVTGPLPWLYYGGNTWSKDTNMGLSVSFNGGSLAQGSVSSLTFVLATYALNGTWLGYQTWATQLQMCGMTATESTLWTRFGWLYQNQCELSVTDILAQLPRPSREPVFYDLYIQTGPSSLYPVPIKNANYDTYTANNDDTVGAVRRFYYVDGSLGTVQTSAPSAADFKVVQYPLSMQLTVTVQDDAPDQLLPPVLRIVYAASQVGSDTGMKSLSFMVTYNNPDSLNKRFWYAWRTCLIVFEVVISFPLLTWRLFQYMRKRRGDQADQDFIIFGVVTICDCGSLGLCCVLFVVSLYYLITYKLQEAVYFIMLQDGDVKNFKVTVILAVVGQSVATVYRFWCQSKVDVFLLDWEKPRRVLSRDGNREEDAPVSAWRTLMIANELAELQTARATNLAVTWLLMVFILVGQGVQNAGDITPDANDFTYYQTAVTSIILRFGVEVAFLLVLFLGQYLFRRLLWWPYVSDPLMNLVDLMYLANVSLVLLDEPHCGYYVHGRNHSQHSDATLRDLNVELEKEGEGLVANRGLVTSYSDRKLNDNQLFLMYVTEEIRRQYEAKILKQVEQAANDVRMRKGQVVTFVKGVGKPSDSALHAKDDVAELFRGMVEEVERNHATQVVDPTWFQLIFQLPPEAALHNTVFVHDYFRSFATTMLLGNEMSQYLFEAIFFLAVDMSLSNIPLSAALTYVVSRVLTWLLGTACKNNLSQKTMVDQHFLI